MAITMPPGEIYRRTPKQDPLSGLIENRACRVPSGRSVFVESPRRPRAVVMNTGMRHSAGLAAIHG